MERTKKVVIIEETTPVIETKTEETTKYSLWIKVNDKIVEEKTNDVLESILNIFKSEKPRIAVTIKVSDGKRTVTRWLSPRDIKNMSINKYFQIAFIKNIAL